MKNKIVIRRGLKTTEKKKLDPKICKECDGYGRIDTFGYEWSYVACPKCKGTGRKNE